MIGRDVLPVNSDVATSLAFQISNAEEDSFHLVFANGDKQEIGEEELKKYGSQNEIDKEGIVDVSKSISYIEVKTPIKFLPKGVTITDTPGIGSTYPHHTVITKQQVKLADAVIYVMNPSPLETVEIEFLKEVSKITPSIMFVMTKVDTEMNESAVQENIDGNKKHIFKSIGTVVGKDFHVYPMSSVLLMNAAQTNDKESSNFEYEISGYDEVRNAIQLLIFQTIGYYRAGAAFNAAIDYYQVVMNALAERKKLVSSSLMHYKELVEQYSLANKTFSERLGEGRRKEVMASVDDILRIMSSDFTEIFSVKGSVYPMFEKEIDALSLDQTHKYSEELGDRVVAQVQSSWETVTSLVYQRMQEKILAYSNECQMAMPKAIKVAVVDEVKDAVDIQDLSGHERLVGIRSEMLMGTAVTGALGTVASAAYFFAPTLMTPALPVIAPVLVVMSVGVILWGAISGSQKAKRQKLEKNQRDLKKYVQDVLLNCQKQLVEVSLANNKYKSLYQGFVDAIREQAQKSLQDIFAKYHKELDALKKTIIESKQNPKAMESLDFMIQTWQKNKESLQAIRTSIDGLK